MLALQVFGLLKDTNFVKAMSELRKAKETRNAEVMKLEKELNEKNVYIARLEERIALKAKDRIKRNGGTS
jgi:flagellar motility protein MotE (MotC chaperone)